MITWKQNVKHVCGCNRLELAEFKEIYRCENYMRGDTDEV